MNELSENFTGPLLPICQVNKTEELCSEKSQESQPQLSKSLLLEVSLHHTTDRQKTL